MLGDLLNDNRKLGAGLTAFGSLFLLLGIILFFDTALLALGNLLFLAGITLLIGARQTVVFFGRRAKIRGTICFFLGIVLVLCKWAIVGMFLELFGILNLFGNFFPIVISIFRNTPVIGTFIQYPPIAAVLDKILGATLPTSSKYAA